MARPPERLRQVGWLIAIWAGSVATLGVAAMLIRVLMEAAGMRSH
ncbi:DUF2474 domain-containing protein [Cupriavidus plantarum]|nr:DUF2474 domain-containing protein [Cupriavidus plantarum]REE89166.1 uncharacterized protein DUF2474 [Cupriavidus plantarum]